MFMDSSQNYWIYSEGTFTITAPNGVLYPQKGDVAVSDTGEHTYTHTSTPEEVIEKAEEHFLVYAVEKKKTKIQLDLNLKIQDRYLTLN